LLFDHGINNLYSILEMLIFLKMCRVDEAKPSDIAFRFRHFGIEPTTFPAVKDDERKKDPRLESKAEWPAFYEAHRVDVDKLWIKAQNVLFDSPDEALVGAVEDDADDDLTSIEDDVIPTAADNLGQ
jgi:hypothetical protein